jgi:uncharacterized protein (TIGR00730 family)
MSINNLVVFCGSSTGIHSHYADATRALGRLLAQEGIGLVYGGAAVGLMGILANTVLENGGRVTGIIPAFLHDKEIAHQSLTELIQVHSMHERKFRMQDLSDGVIALPGGYGTLDELFEMLTWAQLGLHQKPIGLLNIAGFYDPLITMIDHMRTQGFLQAENQDRVLVDGEASALLIKMRAFIAQPSGSSMGPEQI